MQPRISWAPVFLILLLATPGKTQDGAAAWKSLQEPVFDPEKATAVGNLALTRDRVKLTFLEGSLQFSQPVNGIVYGAAFLGRGRVQVQPPNNLEAQQLRLHTGQETLDQEFTEAVLVFSDETFDEIGKQARWTRDPGTRLDQLFAGRQKEREDHGAEWLPRIFLSVFSGDRRRTAFFGAELKTGKGWIQVVIDALEQEDVRVTQWKNWGVVQRPDTWMRFPAGNRSAQEAFADPLAKDEFLIRGYQIDAAVTESAEMSATARVNLEHRLPGVRVMAFYLDANLRVDSVRQGEQKLEFFQPREPKDRNQSYGDYVAVVLPQAGQAGQKQTLEFNYRGKRVIRRVGPGNYFCESFGWYPARTNSFATRVDFEMHFRHPKKFQLVATGSKVSESADGNFLISAWKSDLPLAVAGFAYGDYKVETTKAGNVDVEIYANRAADDSMASVQRMADGSGGIGGRTIPNVALGSLNPSGMAKTMAQEVANSLRLFEAYFGPYPYRRLAVTNIPYSYGQGWPSLLYLSALSFLDSTQRHSLGLTDQIGISDFFRAHETSHQWWGHRVSWKSYHDQWLSEGFAQFSGNLYVHLRQSPKEYFNRIRMDREELKERDLRNRTFESLGPIWMGTRLASSDAARGYANVIYNKGGLVLHMLRMMFFDVRNKEKPEATFMAMMQEFCQTYHNRAASTEDFKAIVEKYMLPAMDIDGNRKMDWFFNQYVYGTGIPEYRFSYQVQDAGNGQFKITGRVLQSGVATGWKDTLPIYLHTAGRSVRVGWIRAKTPDSTFEFTLPVKPDKLTINDNEDILAEIK